MANNMTRILIETTVRRTLKEIEANPERSIRNLVDMALNFADGKFQHKLFVTTQEMLRNGQSTYYDLVKDVVASVDHDRILSFGMNVGYNSCTVGAATIRSIEASRHFNVPWTISLVIDGSSYAEKAGSYHDIIRQGQALGIYTWSVFCAQQADKLVPLAKAFPDCAFILFCHASEITETLLALTEKVPNIMFSLSYDANAESSCSLLRQKKYPYSVHIVYTEKEAAAIADGSLITHIETLHPAFTFTLPAVTCPKEVQQTVYDKVTEMRISQKYRTVIMDILADNKLIDGVISEDACEACFDGDGQLYTIQNGIFYQEQNLNIFQNSLEDILQKAFPKGEK